MNTTWKAVVGVLLIFIFGCLTGIVGTSVVLHHKMLALLQGGPVAIAQVLETRLTRNLDLDASQKQQIHEALVKNLTQRKELQKEIQPRVRVLNQETLAEINAILKPDQQQLLHENIEKFSLRLGRNPFNTGAADAAAPNATVGQPPAAH